MKICVFGAGAIGGVIAARLKRTGAEVSVVARGDHLAAIERGGLTLEEASGTFTVRLPATDAPLKLGPQDYVILALKAPAASANADRLALLLGPETAVMTAQNGVPWWLFHKFGGSLEDTRIEAADPGGAQWRHIGPKRAIGSVVYVSAEIAAPGRIRHVEHDRISLGEPDGARSERALALSRLLTDAGFRAPVKPRIREEIWLKLIGNAALNPLSVLCGQTLDVMLANAETTARIRALMEETAAVGEALGVALPLSIDKRLDGARAVGAHKTSMLQDFEAGRELELGVIVEAVRELGKLTGTPTPRLDETLRTLRHKLQNRPNPSSP